MSLHDRVPIRAGGIAPSISGPTALVAGVGDVDPSAPELPLQVGGGPHVAALFGIVALALLGGALAVRNRLSERQPLQTEQEKPGDEFVTDREKIRQLVTENGGRMKQSRIVESVDWSKAKVSRLLAELEEDGQITKLRLGRENLVCLPGHEPTASKSPEQSQNE